MGLSNWMAACVVLAGLAGCEKQSAKTADDNLDTLMAEMVSYAEKSLPILATFDGDCSKAADALLALEPLAQDIRQRGMAYEADPAKKAKYDERRHSMKDAMTKGFEEIAKGYHLSMADLDAKEQELKSKCANDAKFQDAQERAGLMKKKR